MKPIPAFEWKAFHLKVLIKSGAGARVFQGFFACHAIPNKSWLSVVKRVVPFDTKQSALSRGVNSFTAFFLDNYLIKCYATPKSFSGVVMFDKEWEKNHCLNHTISKNHRIGDVFFKNNTLLNKIPWFKCEGCNKIFSEDALTQACIEAGGLI